MGSESSGARNIQRPLSEGLNQSYEPADPLKGFNRSIVEFDTLYPFAHGGRDVLEVKET